MKLAALCIIIHPLLILTFSALAVATPDGLAGITNPGYHGLSQVLYEFASSAANNGSGFEGLADNTLFWNIYHRSCHVLRPLPPDRLAACNCGVSDEKAVCQ